jgi:hypothetical protein
MFPRRSTLILASAVAATILPSAAEASQLIDRNATGVHLQTSGGTALLSYSAGGRHWVLATGAINATAPTMSRPQVAFRLHRSISPLAFKGTCTHYRGPALTNLVAACTASDGSYWAVQSWQKALPNFAGAPSAFQAMPELHLSHWRGPTAVLTLAADWSYAGKFQHLFGTLSYAGKPVHGFRTTRYGSPLDTYGRNIYLDVKGSPYGNGWKRENSFVAHNPAGDFCYDLTHGSATEFRATVIGPGVTPDVSVTTWSPGAYDVQKDQAANTKQAVFADRLCRPN